MPSVASMQFTEAREVFQILLELSGLLCTGLTPDQLTTCIRLCEAGVNPEALAIIVRELQKEASKGPSSAADNNIVTDNNNQNL